MPDGTTPKGENDDTKTPKNNGEPNNAPEGGNVDWRAKYEEANKKLTEMNMWKNKAAKLQEDLDKAQQDKIDVETKLTNLQESQAQAQKKQAVETKQSELLSKYSDKTKELVKDLGIELSDAEDESAIKAFTDKVEKINTSTVADGTNNQQPPTSKPPVGSNNARPDVPNPGQSQNLSEEQQLAQEKERLGGITF